jgi:hypothetical protein
MNTQASQPAAAAGKPAGAATGADYLASKGPAVSTSVTGEVITPAAGAVLGATYPLKHHHLNAPLALSALGAALGAVATSPTEGSTADFTVDTVRGLLTVLTGATNIKAGDKLTAAYGYDATAEKPPAVEKPKPSRATVASAATDFAAAVISHLTRSPSTETRSSETDVHNAAQAFAAAIGDYVEGPPASSSTTGN